MQIIFRYFAADKFVRKEDGGAAGRPAAGKMTPRSGPSAERTEKPGRKLPARQAKEASG